MPESQEKKLVPWTEEEITNAYSGCDILPIEHIFWCNDILIGSDKKTAKGHMLGDVFLGYCQEIVLQRRGGFVYIGQRHSKPKLRISAGVSVHDAYEDGNIKPMGSLRELLKEEEKIYDGNWNIIE